MNIEEKITRIREFAARLDLDDEFVLHGVNYPENIKDPLTGKNAKDPETGEWLFGDSQPHWHAGVSNSSRSVRLGEAEPDVAFSSDTITGAIDGLLRELESRLVLPPAYIERHWRTAAQLRAALDKPLPECMEFATVDDFDPWDDVIDGCMGAYSSALDDLAIDVLKAVRDRKTFDLLEGDREVAAELFMHMLAHKLCSYGSSPRGIFPASPEIASMWNELIAKWESYAKLKWSDD